MPNNYTRRTVVSSLAALAAASQTAGSVAGKEAEGQGHGIEQEGATLNRFATTIIGAEITGMFITEDGRFFFNVQHPDANLDGEDEPGILGAVTGVDMNPAPQGFPERPDSRGRRRRLQRRRRRSTRAVRPAGADGTG